jgi:hypothetical protein
MQTHIAQLGNHSCWCSMRRRDVVMQSLFYEHTKYVHAYAHVHTQQAREGLCHPWQFMNLKTDNGPSHRICATCCLPSGPWPASTACRRLEAFDGRCA